MTATWLALLIPLALFLSYRQAVAWERQDLRRQVDDCEWQRARRATGGRHG